MIDPKNQNYDPEAATFVPGASSGGSPARTGNAVQTPLPSSPPGGSEAPTMLEGALPPMAPVTRQNPPPTAVTPGSPPAPGALLLQPGILLGNRYQIIHMLGEGGMGAVYKAKDIELDRVIALKVIRPELASNPEILQRFKQELILARQVTDRNVIRIFDLGEANGIRFITMEYVEGESLYHILRRQGKVPVNEAVEMMRQMLSGLQAAHREGVIHRDLKPGNIMRDSQGRIVVMDFGLARSVEGDGMTRTGTMMGTMEYMSPEQAQAKELDARSDIFTVGLICYELLTGKMPYHADSVVASLLKRMQERALPASDSDKSIPQPLSLVLSKCLERDPAERYSNVGEIIRDLESWQSGGAAATLSFRSVEVWAQERWIYVAVAVLVLASVFFAVMKWHGRSTTPSLANGKAITILVGDFNNHTGDPIFDGTLEPMFNVALEGGSFINAYNRGKARSLAEKLPNPTNKLDEQSSRLVALSQGISTIITGEISLRGNAYTVSALALDAATGKVVAEKEVTAANKDDVVSTIPKLTAPIRRALGDNTPEAAQLENERGAFTAASLEVVHQYGIAMEQQFAGKTDEALRSFGKAAELDPNFARAYSGMTSAAIKLDHPADAEKYIKLAMEHVDRMTDRERYRVRGLYYGTTGNWQKCAEEYTQLVKVYPGDNIGHNNLAVCLSGLRNLSKALEEAKLDNELHPNAAAHANVTFFMSYTGDFQGGEREARQYQQHYPSDDTGYLALAFAQLGQGQLSPAEESYSKLQQFGAHGASLSNWGLADLYLYQGRFTNAVHSFEQGAISDLANKDNDSAAEKFAALAYAHLSMQQKGAAIAAAEKALANSQTVKVRFLAGLVFAETGQQAKAQELATKLAAEVQSEAQADAKIVEGDLALSQKDAPRAIRALTDANNLLDTWLGRFELGRAYLEANAFAEADSEFDQCLKRRGEALSLFMDDVPSYGFLPPVYYYQGRVREGLKSPGFAEPYRTYLSIRGQAGEDPLLAEIHRRLGQ
jgi:eukaryotic-like serine/threonine-protein kinase